MGARRAMPIASPEVYREMLDRCSHRGGRGHVDRTPEAADEATETFGVAAWQYAGTILAAALWPGGRTSTHEESSL
jgi:hypothetical protein